MDLLDRTETTGETEWESDAPCFPDGTVVVSSQPHRPSQGDDGRTGYQRRYSGDARCTRCSLTKRSRPESHSPKQRYLISR